MNQDSYRKLIELENERNKQIGRERELPLLGELETLSRAMMDEEESDEQDVGWLERSRSRYIACLIELESGRAREEWIERLVDLLDEMHGRYASDFDHPDPKTRLLSIARFRDFSRQVLLIEEATIDGHPALSRYRSLHQLNKERFATK